MASLQRFSSVPPARSAIVWRKPVQRWGLIAPIAATQPHLSVGGSCRAVRKEDRTRRRLARRVAILSFNHPDRSGRPAAYEGEEMSIAHSWNEWKRLLVVLAIAVAAMFFAVPGPAKANLGSYCGHGISGHWHWLPSPVYWSIFFDRHFG